MLSLQCPSSAPAPPQGAPGGSGWLGTPRARLSHWAPSQCLGCSSEPPPKSPILLPLTLQVGSEMNDLRRREISSMDLPAEMGAAASRARTQPINGASRPPAWGHDTTGLAPLSAPPGDALQGAPPLSDGAQADELHTQVELLRAMLGRGHHGLPASEAACLQVLPHAIVSRVVVGHNSHKRHSGGGMRAGAAASRARCARRVRGRPRHSARWHGPSNLSRRQGADDGSADDGRGLTVGGNGNRRR